MQALYWIWQSVLNWKYSLRYAPIHCITHISEQQTVRAGQLLWLRWEYGGLLTVIEEFALWWDRTTVQLAVQNAPVRTLVHNVAPCTSLIGRAAMTTKSSNNIVSYEFLSTRRTCDYIQLNAYYCLVVGLGLGLGLWLGLDLVSGWSMVMHT